MILNHKQKEALVIKLANKGKTTRAIAKEVHISLKDIGVIIRKATGEVEPKKEKEVLEEDIYLSDYGDDIDIEPFGLTQDVKNHILVIMKAFGLEFGCLDFIIDKNDKLIFLEINPTGDWAYIEDVTDMPITESLSKLILKNTTTV